MYHADSLDALPQATQQLLHMVRRTQRTDVDGEDRIEVELMQEADVGNRPTAYDERATYQAPVSFADVDAQTGGGWELLWNEEKQAHVHPVTGRRVDHISGDYTFETDEENESVHSVEEDESLLFILADGEGPHGRNPCATERGIFSSEDENVDVAECPSNQSCGLESSSDESDLEDEFVDWPLQADQFARNASCLLYTSPSPRDATLSRMPSSA